MNIRLATTADEAALARIDAATWTAEVSPAPARVDGRFFDRTDPGDVLVAEVDKQVAGYAIVRKGGKLASHAHVWEINGLAVDPTLQGRGAGRALVEACVDQARQAGARKVTLRVLGFNTRAQRLYEACGFQIEGLLREEYLLAGRYVDDVFMARVLTGAADD